MVKQLPELKKKTLTPKQLKHNHFQLGLIGERLACNFLLKNKYKILAQNIRVKNNEIDVVAFDTVNCELVFIEVKTRSSDSYGNPSYSVNYKKIRSMQKVAAKYRKINYKQLLHLGCADSLRFDIIAILYFEKNGGASFEEASETKKNYKIQHFENITWP